MRIDYQNLLSILRHEIDLRHINLAIDGRCCSGKTTLARRLSSDLGAQVVHMDDFFLPHELRTNARLYGEPGGNVHSERFLSEVIPHICACEAFSYGVFDCSENAVLSRAYIADSRLVVVEGVYCMRDEFLSAYDITVFLEINQQEQEQRVRAREGGRARLFLDRFIPLEEAYFKAYNTKGRADYIIEA